MSALRALSLAVLIGLICGSGANAEDRCGGVLMAPMTTVMKDRKETVQKLGFYAIDGGLVMDGKSTCTSIRIECSKEARTCRTATAITQAAMGKAQVIGVMMSDDYRVTEWLCFHAAGRAGERDARRVLLVEAVQALN